MDNKTFLHITRHVTETVHTIRHAGLHEAYFSTDPENAPKLVSWAIDQGWIVEEAEWNNPESLYVGTKTGQQPLTVLSFKF